MTILLALLLLIVGFWYFFQLETVVTRGNVHESADEVTALVTGRFDTGNTVLTKLFNTERNVGGVGFVDRVNAVITSRSSIRVDVKEKRMVGYVEDHGSYYYLGKDGKVEAVSAAPYPGDGIYAVKGLELLTSVEVGHTLPIQGTKPFVLLDTLRSSVDRYKNLPDTVTFAEDGSMTLTFGKVNVLIGDGTNLQGRMEELSGIMKKMDETWSGTLHLENFDGSQKQIVFDRT